jgi:hypothetical protein
LAVAKWAAANSANSAGWVDWVVAKQAAAKMVAIAAASSGKVAGFQAPLSGSVAAK